ncbi:hypothetical protein [Nonomuraea dietziae]|uniref:hypothetical protein n=1 Tax=Nonomuraea dietziae TaxID=65515 RepID=UPI0031D1C14F
MGVVAGRAPRGRWRRLAQDRQEGSAFTSVTIAQALEVALCYGWIDSQRKALDEHVLPAALLPPPQGQPVVAGERADGGGADRRQADAAARPGRGRGRPGRRQMGRRPTPPSATPPCRPTWPRRWAGRPEAAARFEALDKDRPLPADPADC